jgi:hypothetical protein
MPNRTEARPAKAVLTYATGRLPLLRLFSTPLSISLTERGSRRTNGASLCYRLCLLKKSLS